MTVLAGSDKLYIMKYTSGVPDGGLALEGSAGPPPKSDFFQVDITDKCTMGQWSNIIFKGRQ